MDSDKPTTDCHFSPTGKAFMDDKGRCTCEPVPTDTSTPDPNDAWLKLHIVDGYTAAEAIQMTEQSKSADKPTTERRNPGFDGMDARRDGLPVDACPYEPGPQRTAWVVGWYIAAQEKQERQQ